VFHLSVQFIFFLPFFISLYTQTVLPFFSFFLFFCFFLYFPLFSFRVCPYNFIAIFCTLSFLLSNFFNYFSFSYLYCTLSMIFYLSVCPFHLSFRDGYFSTFRRVPRLQKRLLASSCLPVRPPVRMEQLDFH
jgi:hypothetical protein